MMTQDVAAERTRTEPPASVSRKRVVIVGNPNVGKSVLFNRLTGVYVTVSNYPGTTVEVSRGRMKAGDYDCDIVDTPGMYSMLPLTEEERVARHILLEQRPDVVLHVIDAKMLDRMLPLTLQLVEAGLPVVLVVNMMDEARRLGVKLDSQALEQALGVTVVPLVATTGEGVKQLRQAIATSNSGPPRGLRVPSGSIAWPLQAAESTLAATLSHDYPLAKPAVADLLLQGDAETIETVKNKEPRQAWQSIETLLSDCRNQTTEPPEYHLAVRRRKHVEALLDGAAETETKVRKSFGTWLSKVMMQPLTGIPILLVVLYVGLYKFVGEFGSGTAVDFLEGTVFEGYINPFMIRLVDGIVPWEPIRELLAGEYGVLTLGLRYAIAIILPIVTFFFLVFSIIEDSGYLPRLAMLIDRSFKKLGLSGRAVIPLVLGFGCDTMATMVTRTLPTIRERLISTLLLALAVPCSAQLGVILALVAGKPAVFGIWAAVVTAVFFAVGFLAARLLPGTPPVFYMEIPPLRMPRPVNVLVKTYTRLGWYLKEVIPLFLLASLLIWVGQVTGLFDLALRALSVPVGMIGLPSEAAEIFLFGFFRRDYGAAGLYDLNKEGLLTNAQLAVSCVALTLFLPCIAQFLINVKERGAKTGIAVSAFVLVFSFVVAWLLNGLLQATGVLS